ncbi:hypothetical protein Tco_1222591 [Tanacetum coccineum]
METEEPVSKKVITGIGLAYASVRRYLSSHVVPRRFPVLSNSARNFFWLQSFTKALRINWYSSPMVVWAIVTFLASKARYASFPRYSGKELRKTCFRLTSSTPFKQ